MNQIVFDTRGNKKQKLCAKYWADDSTAEIIYGGSKSSAKSFTGCSLIFGDALTYPGTHYFIARKTLEDLKKFTIPSINEVLFEVWNLSEKYINYNAQDHVFTLYNESKVYLLAAKYMPSDPLYQRFGSMQMTRGWIEEAGEFDKSCHDNLKISIGRWKNDTYGIIGKLLNTCNPSKNYLYEDYKKWKSGELEDWKKFIQALPTDNKMLQKGYLENLERTLAGSEKDRLLHGDWEYSDDPTALIEYDAIIDLFRNDQVSEGREKYIIADVAMQGSDSFVVGVWYGFVLVDFLIMEKSSGKQVISEINRMKMKHKIRNTNIVYDSDGVGAFIGGEDGFIRGAKAFVNNSKPEPDKDGNPQNYENLKTQCYYKLADMVNDGELHLEAIPEKLKDRVIREFEMVKSRDSDKEGKIKMIRKEEVKSRLGSSPDVTDMCAMRIWPELQRKPQRKHEYVAITI